MQLLHLLYKAVRLYFNVGADQAAAALAYFAPFALVPLMVFSITLVGFFTGPETVVQLLQSWGNALGDGLSSILTQSIDRFDAVTAAYYVPWLGALVMFGLVLTTFGTLSLGLQRIWNIQSRGFRGWVERLVRSFVFFLLIQLYLIFVIAGELIIATVFGDLLAFSGYEQIRVAALLVFTVILFTSGYRILTWDSLPLRARFAGGMVAATLFLFTQQIAGWWLSTPVYDMYGTAGAVLGLLVWIYLATSIIYYGAAFAAVYSQVKKPML